MSDAWDVGRTQKGDLYRNPKGDKRDGWQRVAICFDPQVAQDIVERLNQQELERAQTIAHRANRQLAEARELNLAMTKLLAEVHEELHRLTSRYDYGHEMADNAERLLALWPKEGN